MSGPDDIYKCGCINFEIRLYGSEWKFNVFPLYFYKVCAKGFYAKVLFKRSDSRILELEGDKGMYVV